MKLGRSHWAAIGAAVAITLGTDPTSSINEDRGGTSSEAGQTFGTSSTR
jgi:hypothetical protein